MTGKIEKTLNLSFFQIFGPIRIKQMTQGLFRRSVGIVYTRYLWILSETHSAAPRGFRQFKPCVHNSYRPTKPVNHLITVTWRTWRVHVHCAYTVLCVCNSISMRTWLDAWSSPQALKKIWKSQLSTVQCKKSKKKKVILPRHKFRVLDGLSTHIFFWAPLMTSMHDIVWQAYRLDLNFGLLMHSKVYTCMEESKLLFEDSRYTCNQTGKSNVHTCKKNGLSNQH